MNKITILKSTRGKETLRLTDVTTLAESIRSLEYETEVNDLRRLYPILKLERRDDGSLSGANNFTGKIPRVCFASTLENRNH